MNSEELLQRLLFLNPNANFAIHDCTLSEYAGEGYPIEMDGFLVSWNKTNELKCPSIEEVKSVDIIALNEKMESDRKQIRNDKYSDDLTLKATYSNEKKTNPSLKFSDYLDQLEAASVSDPII